jgi:hypothetical protein
MTGNEILDKVLAEGDTLAEMVFDHLRDMGRAAATEREVEKDGKKWTVRMSIKELV